MESELVMVHSNYLNNEEESFTAEEFPTMVEPNIVFTKGHKFWTRTQTLLCLRDLIDVINLYHKNEFICIFFILLPYEGS